MSKLKYLKTICRSCHGGCGVIAHVKSVKVVKVEGDPDSPISHGSLCSKGLAITQLAYHPDWVLYPMIKDCPIRSSSFSSLATKTAMGGRSEALSRA